MMEGSIPITVASVAAGHCVDYRLIQYSAVSRTDTQWLLSSLSSTETPCLGLDTEFDGPAIGLIQLATNTRCLLITVPRVRGTSKIARNQPLDEVLSSDTILKTGAELTTDALLLYHNFGHRLNSGIDVTRVHYPSILGEKQPNPQGLFALYSRLCLPADQPLAKDRQTTTTKWCGVSFTKKQIRYGVLDAWVSRGVALARPALLQAADRLNLSGHGHTILKLLGDWLAADLTVREEAPTSYRCAFSKVTVQKDGRLSIVCSEFRNKLEANDKVRLRLVNGTWVDGSVCEAKHGKTKLVKLDKFTRIPVKTIEVTECSNVRSADDIARTIFTRELLHHALPASRSPIFDELFFSGENSQVALSSGHQYHIGEHLNESQRNAARQMLAGEKRVTLLHGPPGTGKTSTIAAVIAASCYLPDHSTVICAQTNSAVRNLAEALYKNGVTDFKILVSDAFYIEWHEAEYIHFNDHVIETSKLQGLDARKQDLLIGRRTTVLCSMAQLSSPNLIAILRRKQLRHIILDEAFQLATYNLPHILEIYRKSLRRLSCVGDPKQLAPFANDQSNTVRSVFDLISSDLYLEVQYRMPHDVGSFTSASVYGGQLQSARAPAVASSVGFVDVQAREESTQKGVVNLKEAEVIVQLVMSYIGTNFLIVTPYNKQRELITKLLQNAIAQYNRLHPGGHLPAGLADDRVRSIDTSQGHEADFIFISLVRTDKPGFLKNKLRANVALTRAKKHLILVGNLRFFTDLTEKGHDTHFGHFIRHFLPTSEMLKRNDIINGKRFSFGAGSGSSVARSRRMEPLEGLLSALRIEYLK